MISTVFFFFSVSIINKLELVFERSLCTLTSKINHIKFGKTQKGYNFKEINDTFKLRKHLVKHHPEQNREKQRERERERERDPAASWPRIRG
jgi:hypothetical protein